MATGTGDLLLAIDRRLPRLTRTVGVDLAPDMLHIARDKLARAGCAAKLTLGDAHRLPFEEHSFDAVTVAFGIRNMDDRPRALTEMRRVLARGGTLAVLEFSLPESPRLRALYLTYFRHVLPAIGRLVSGDGESLPLPQRIGGNVPVRHALRHHAAEGRFSGSHHAPPHVRGRDAVPGTQVMMPPGRAILTASA